MKILIIRVSWKYNRGMKSPSTKNPNCVNHLSSTQTKIKIKMHFSPISKLFKNQTNMQIKSEVKEHQRKFHHSNLESREKSKI